MTTTTLRREIATIDISVASAAELAAELVASSCVFIVGHGVSDELRRRMTTVSEEFFALPQESKQKLQWDGQGLWHGWQPHGAADLSKLGDKPPNLVEWYMVHDLDSYSNWPTDPVQLRPIWTEYYQELRRVASQVMTMVAHGLDLPGEDLAAWTDRQFGDLCVNHYPAQPEPPLPGQVRLTPHTDENAITILTADDAQGGLEVRFPGSSEWTPVRIPPHAFLIQAGDLLARYTNRHVKANMHRVVNPERSVAATARRNTLVYFHFPALDTLVTPAPSCVDATGGRAVYEPVVALDYMLKHQSKYSADPEYVDGER